MFLISAERAAVPTMSKVATSTSFRMCEAREVCTAAPALTSGSMPPLSTAGCGSRPRLERRDSSRTGRRNDRPCFASTLRRRLARSVAATKGPIRVHYLTVDEIESGLVDLSTRHPSLCRMVTLPHRTFEGRTVTALRIGRPDDGGVRAGVLFLAGVHAMEWGGSDTALAFAADLLDSYVAGTDLVYGGKTFGAGDIASVIDTVDVFVLACVNPDGRATASSRSSRRSGARTAAVFRTPTTGSART